MFKYLVFFALLAVAFAAPEAKPEPQFYHGYVSPYAYGAHGYSGYSPYYSGYYGYGHGSPYYGHYGYY